MRQLQYGVILRIESKVLPAGGSLSFSGFRYGKQQINQSDCTNRMSRSQRSLENFEWLRLQQREGGDTETKRAVALPAVRQSVKHTCIFQPLGMLKSSSNSAEVAAAAVRAITTPSRRWRALIMVEAKIMAMHPMIRVRFREISPGTPSICRPPQFFRSIFVWSRNTAVSHHHT